ncbi:MAG TPA: Ig-like domain-containing protein [Gemmatimonadaceae bacterium]|jgi:hypothetical protein|nr:Ig-like domain-containing protein [Gemmatimonadaceae bacterium]
MRPAYDRDRASARVPHRSIAISLLTVAVAAALSACGDSATAPGATTTPEAREARAFTIAGVTYPTVAIQGANTSLAIGSKESLTAKLATPTATWMGAYMTWQSSNTSVASISTSNQGSTNGDIATVTGVASGTATISATTESGTSESITITVGNASNTQNPAGYHEPAGMVQQINTGAMSAAPSTSYEGKWTEGTASFENWSPNTMSSTGEWAQNISTVPGGTGLRVTYGPSLSGGNSPVRFGTSIANHGSGDLYLRWKFRLSPNWTLSEASQLKVMEPRTVNADENHVISFSPYGQASDGMSMWPNMFLQFGTGSGTFSKFVPGNSSGQAASTSLFASTLGNVGGAARGNWHLIEVYAQHESPAGAGNGQLTMWVDGTMIYQSPMNVSYFMSGEAMGWEYLQFDPTYGGDVASDHPPYSIYWDIDDLYVSTK